MRAARRRASLMILGSLMICGCGGRNAGPQDGPGAALRVAVVYTAKPALYRGPSGEVTGFLYDMEKDVAKRLGQPMDFQVTSFENIVTGVQGGKFDIGTGVDATQHREQVLDIVPFYQGGYSFITLPAGQQAFAGRLDDLCGHVIGVIAGGSDGAALETQAQHCSAAGLPANTLLRFQSEAAALLALKSGKIEAMTAFSWYETPPGTVMAGPTFAVRQTGVAVAKGSPLAPRIAAALEAMIADGSYGRILGRYGLSRVALSQVRINPEQ